MASCPCISVNFRFCLFILFNSVKTSFILEGSPVFALEVGLSSGVVTNDVFGGWFSLSTAGDSIRSGLCILSIEINPNGRVVQSCTERFSCWVVSLCVLASASKELIRA
ncbi:hypothetical protein BX666DRAFT_1942864 [Dichotomocladium elegans]|nr:hypothetical protein BX666DRAFT_1942864 [Dichotomocladium elegans]